MILKTTYKRRPMLYGSATAYNWVNDPFHDPLEKMSRKEQQKIYNERKKKAK